MYYDKQEKHLLYKGHYRDHRLYGKWKYAYEDGQIYLREKYLKNDWVKVTHYYHNGRKQMEGMARYIVMPDTVFYRWEGNWIKYDSTGNISEVDYYRFGKFAWVNRNPGKRKKIIAAMKASS